MSATASNGSLKRREMDVTKLMMCDYSLALVNDSVSKFHVSFRGPVHSPYANGLWRVKVELPEEYPYKSPSIGFVNKIYHPNVCPTNGAVCLDVINQTWSPMYDLVNVFEIFLPQLLLYPNPSDPLNGEAAGLLLKDPLAYEQKVKEMVAKHASAFAVATLMTKHDSSLEGQREAADQNDDLGAEAYVSSDEENEDPRRETNAKRAR